MKQGKLCPIVAICKDCGEEFIISIKEQLFAQEGKGFVLPKRCPDCRKNKRDKIKLITCIDCGEVFEFSVSEQEFFKKNGFDDPKRCKSCRQTKRRNVNGQSVAEENQ